MRREDFNHVIAAAAQGAEEREIVVISSQAILGTVEEPPSSLLISMEADVYPRNDPAKAPASWTDRLVSVEIPPRVGQEDGVIALCLEVHDLVLSKCVAGRDRDWDFARDAIAADLVQVGELVSRADDLPVSASDREHIQKMLAGIAVQLDS
jgi:hypothetical protein